MDDDSGENRTFVHDSPKKMASPNYQLEVPGQATRILLHACCAPCSGAVIECMLENGLQPTVFYFNPNIFPQEEYERRKAENIRYVTSLHLPFVDGDYDHDGWKKQIKGWEHEPERGRRCLECITMRMAETARYAAEHGFAVFTTTLTSSRWKDAAQIAEAGHTAATLYPNLTFWAQNWRKGGLSNRRNELVKQYDFYNQTWCGCEYGKRMNPIELIQKYYPVASEAYKIIVKHSRDVAEKAVRIGQAHPEWALDLPFVEEAAMLHDIGAFLCFAPEIGCFGKAHYICHGYLGADLLRKEGFPRHALVCERHTGTGLTQEMIERYNLPLPRRDMCPQSIEEQLICFADLFYSKTKPDEEKSIEKIRKSMAKYGETSVLMFDNWCKLFLR